MSLRRGAGEVERLVRYVMPEDIVRNRDVGTGYAEGLGPAGERASPRPHPPGGGGRGYRRPLPWASAGPGGDGPARGGGAGHRRPRRSSLPWLRKVVVAR